MGILPYVTTQMYQRAFVILSEVNQSQRDKYCMTSYGIFQARTLEWVAIAFSSFSLPALKATGFLNAGLSSVCGILTVSQELHGQGSQNIKADSCVF